MLSKCSNPLCSKPLHYLRDGKVYRVEIKEEEPVNSNAPFLVSDTGKKQHRFQHFWLCGECTRTMTLRFDDHGHITVVPKAVKMPAMPAMVADPAMAKKAAAS